MMLSPGKKVAIKDISIFNQLKKTGKLSKNEFLIKTGAIADGSCLFHSIFYIFPEYYSLNTQQQIKFVKDKRLEIANNIDINTFINFNQGNIAFFKFSEKFDENTMKVYLRNEFLQENLSKQEFQDIITNALAQTTNMKNDLDNNIDSDYKILYDEYIYNTILEGYKKSNKQRFGNIIRKIIDMTVDNIFKKFKKSLEDTDSWVDEYLIYYIMKYYNINIYIISDKTKEPYTISSCEIYKSNNPNVVVYYIEELHYESLGIYNKDTQELQREFDRNHPFIKALYNYLCTDNLQKKSPIKVDYNQTFTLTFGNRAENHKGMQIIGKKLDHGLSVKDLEQAKKYFSKRGAETITVNLNDLLDEEDKVGVEKAELLIIKNGVNYIVDADELYDEIDKTPKDKLAFMYGRVVNKKARHNNIFSDFNQEPEYEEGKGTIINFNRVPILNKIREEMPKIIPNNEGVVDLQCEGNYYYDIKNTYIGFHGDTEREIVIAIRIGGDFNIYYQWYKNSEPVGKLFEYTLKHGDMYFMSEKAVGNDWKSKSKYTLRHAAAKNPKLIGLK